MRRPRTDTEVVTLTVADVDTAVDDGDALSVTGTDVTGRRRTFSAPRQTLLGALGALVRHQVDLVHLHVEPWRFVERLESTAGSPPASRER